MTIEDLCLIVEIDIAAFLMLVKDCLQKAHHRFKLRISGSGVYEAERTRPLRPSKSNTCVLRKIFTTLSGAKKLSMRPDNVLVSDFLVVSAEIEQELFVVN